MIRKKEESHLQKTIYTIIIAFAIVLFWRGIWGLLDLYLFPENHFVSYIISIIFGILILSSTKNLIKHLV